MLPAFIQRCGSVERLSLLQMLTECNELHVDGPYLVGYLLTRIEGPQVTDWGNEIRIERGYVVN